MKKELVVEIEFSIGKKNYKVIRGAKPNKFELYINDTLINQDATMKDYQEHLEKNVLKMSYRSFTQVAILGSANFTPFMQLKAVEEKKVSGRPIGYLYIFNNARHSEKEDIKSYS